MMYRSLLPVYIITNVLFRGVLPISNEAQRIFTVECTAVIGRLYSITFEYRSLNVIVPLDYNKQYSI